MILKRFLLNAAILICAGFAITSCSSVTVETNESYEILSLPDGTEVLLNKNSSVEYKKDFIPREIKLKGEAFLKVTSNKTPFVVRTDRGDIKVIGTDFNVKTTAETLKVEVEKGVVEVKTTAGVKKLKKGTQAIYDKGKNTLTTGKADYKFRIWLSELKIEFKKSGKEIKKGAKKTSRELKKLEKEFQKGLNNH